MSANKIGVLLVNLGTPDKPSVTSIRKYLKEFLMDSYVIQLPGVIRAILVYGLILPFRPKKILKAYQAIWTSQGSPLLVISRQLQALLQQNLGQTYQVELGMRYGTPSIQHALDKLQQTCEKIIVIPQFPQYAESTTRSLYQVIFNYFKQQLKIPELIMIRDFYAMPAFIHAQANQLKKAISEQDFKPDYYLFSFHGLPENHVKKIDTVPCDLSQPCPSLSMNNQYCYRAQCFETARRLAQSLNLSETDYQVSFQSRLGRTPWIKPYTDKVLPGLRKKGIKNLAVICPAFTADCLETLEEMNIRAKAQWLKLGGEGFMVAPCVNSDPIWVQGLGDLIRSKMLNINVNLRQ